MWDAHNKDLNMELNAGNRRQPCMRHSSVNVGPRFLCTCMTQSLLPLRHPSSLQGVGQQGTGI